MANEVAKWKCRLECFSLWERFFLRSGEKHSKVDNKNPNQPVNSLQFIDVMPFDRSIDPRKLLLQYDTSSVQDSCPLVSLAEYCIHFAYFVPTRIWRLLLFSFTYACYIRALDIISSPTKTLLFSVYSSSVSLRTIKRIAIQLINLLT